MDTCFMDTGFNWESLMPFVPWLILCILPYILRTTINRALSRELESYKAAFQEQHTRFSKLHEMRAERLMELYSKFAELDDHLFVTPYAATGSPKANEETRANTVASITKELQLLVSKYWLLLNDSSFDLIEKYLQGAGVMATEAMFSHELPSHEIDRKTRIFEKLKPHKMI